MAAKVALVCSVLALILVLVILAISCDREALTQLAGLESRVDRSLAELKGQAETLEETVQSIDRLEETAAQVIADMDSLDRRLTGHVVGNSPPLGIFRTQSSGLTLSEFTFENASADRDSEAGSLLSCMWEFGDGTTSSSWNATHAYRVPGTYVVTLTVTDGYDARSQTSSSILVQNRPPEACFDVSPVQASFPWRPPSDGKNTSDNPFRFNDCSSDRDGRIVAWTWQFGDGGTADEPSPTHKFADGGTYEVQLLVRDNDGDESRLDMELVILRGCEACLAAVNRASERSLDERCCEIGKVKARRLVEKREELRQQNGVGFTSVEEIDGLSQFGPETMKCLFRCLSCDGCLQ